MHRATPYADTCQGVRWPFDRRRTKCRGHPLVVDACQRILKHIPVAHDRSVLVLEPNLEATGIAAEKCYVSSASDKSLDSVAHLLRPILVMTDTEQQLVPG